MDDLSVGLIAKSVDPRKGGLERHVFELGQALEEKGVSVTVFVREGHGYEECDAEVVEVPFIEVGQDLLNMYTSYPGYYRALKERMDELDIVHGHGPEAMAYTFGRKLGKFDKPFIYTLHGIGSEHVSRDWLKPAAKILFRPEKYNLNEADRIITVSEFTRSEAVDYYGLNKDELTIVNNGVDLEKFGGDWNFGNNLLFVGHLVSRKGPQMLLDSFEKLRDNEELELTFVGSGRMKEELVEVAKSEGLGDRVHFRENISDEELRELYSKSIFCMPSAYEGFGMVYIEAMASGAPVIASKDTAIEEVVENGENGFLVERDSDSISQTVEDILDDRNLRERLSTGARNTAEGFDWSKIADQVLEVYSSEVE
jgi:phosphatidylinositol alpha-1,6-mannosyltransferase